MTAQYVFESRYTMPGKLTARQMIRDDLGTHTEKWRHKWNRTAWDYSLSATDNHIQAARYACRVQLQKDPVDVTFGGDTERGQLWIVTTTD